MKKNKSYLIAVPDKKNPNIIRYHRVTGPRFMYGKSIVKEYSADGTEKIAKENNVKFKKQNPKTEMPKTEMSKTEKPKAPKKDLVQEEEETRLQIATEVRKIMDSSNGNKNAEPVEPRKNKTSKPKKKISKPKKESEYFELRYTMPKERGIVARIINQMKYENGWYDDIEDYLNDEKNFIWDDMEWSKNAEKRRDQRLYKRVQAYEDADDDITMKRAFLAVKVTTAAALIATLGISVNFLCNEVHDLIHNSSYVAPTQEKSTLENANPGEIEYAERVLAKIDYNFQYLSHDELLDTVIRVGNKPSKITENRAMGAIKNAINFADQKLLEEMIQEAYGAEYVEFGNEMKQELNQLVYEMLDDKIKIWIRSPENVAKIKEKNNINTMETEDVESER